MLDTDTKRRIDTARDILVGKVPDPKSQVEQITIALIYKFMDDLDAESEELGGERQFFAGEFARFGWAKLMRSGLGGHEMLNLYADAITRMPENPGIPLLFRDIFKNAFLPYRDPETLRAFLKIIDEFEYDHSERLGDAFEYLLSVLGSQGDAGQFRTPRHIIDFIVTVIDPKKDESVLDPACGTAGFLISSYKHIRKANTNEQGQITLTPDERGRLADNFKGYDISPDMVRLSLVNMYLHGFADPHISEYDTLTSEEYWNEYADVILANPPFMSPKGGIRPHNRFSVQSRRSEVLFVDYMAEHLTPAGRAGIIVPEGIIFQSQNAHKQLRKMLVEEFLVAVVSLPAGVFNPYSGVKTSILILDKVLAKKTDHIAFFKVENDGFDLGAQRREIDKNDLPQVAEELCEYLARLRADETVDDPQLTLNVAKPEAQYTTDKPITHRLVVEKSKVAEGGEYNLSGERYRGSAVRLSQFPIVPLGEVAEVISGQSPPGKSYNDTGVGTPFYQGKTEFGQMFIGKPTKWTTDPRRFAEKGDILMSVRAPVGPVNLTTQRICIGRGLAAIRPIKNLLLTAYIFYVLHSLESEITGSTGSAFSSINKSDIQIIQIPLPPLEVQREIVSEIEDYQRVIDGARAVVENYRPNIAVDPEWPMVEVREACVVNPRKSDIAAMDGAKIVSFVPMSDMGENRMYFEAKDYKCLKEVGSSYTYFKDNDVLIAKVTPCFENGKAGIAKGLSNGIGFGSSEFYVLRPTEEVLPEWIFLCVATPAFRRWATPQMTGTGGLQRVPRRAVESYKIPLPASNIQQQIVAEIESEQVLVETNLKLIERFEKKIQDAVGRVWGESFT
ncbi:MAG: N-6 DNA methylase [Gemmatimonadetes bacterium]|nr:N-6 DNA methylase [Gemmatimonadota bacterium]